MRKLTILLAAGIMATALWGCGAGSAPASSQESAAVQPQAESQAAQPTKQVELVVSAAASLTDCMNELKAVYESENEGIKLTFNFGASGALQQQIEQGAPADIFISAGKKQMDALVEKGMMQEKSVKDILENKVVLITPKDGERLTSFEQLAEDKVTQIGVGEPKSVPVGQYTEEIFASLSLTEALSHKLVYAKDVREVLSWVETGNVQAGVVYETDAKISDKVQISCTAPEGSHKPVIYPVGVVKETKNAQAAEAFLTFLFTDTAEEIFSSYGFTAA